MLANSFVLMILLPAVTGLLGYLIGRLRNEFSFIGTVASLYYALRLFLLSRGGEPLSLTLMEIAGIPLGFRLDQLSGFILLFVSIFTTLILFYSFRYMRGREGTRGYYLYSLLILAFANGVVLATNLVTLFFFWGGLLLLLYAILLIGRGETFRTARKALVIVGLSDFAMLLGLVLLIVRTYVPGGWIELAPRVPLPLYDPALVAGFVLITAGALAKAGAMPLHTWIPTAAETAPAPVMALIPASLDKLLGIYLLIRLTVYMFDIASNMVLRNVLMAVGAGTILFAVMMALIQKRMMKLLAFHAVSQVGYMVLGIGTGIPVGIAGGLFHMLNNAIYKTGLFLAGGSVEHWAKTDELEKLGGVGRQMPLTFVSFFICAMAIAGVPPLNGFFSKWMVYQGVLGVGIEGNRLFPVFLVAAMFGSVLTLASFLKLIHGLFLGQRPQTLARVREVSMTMWLPPFLLALACVAFGVFAYQLPLRGLIIPGLRFYDLNLTGVWSPIPATLLLLAALGLGAIIYFAGTAVRPVTGRTFVGGERIGYNEESRVPGTAFYSSVKQMPIVGDLLVFGERGAFDLYNWLIGIFRVVGYVFREGVDRALQALTEFIGKLVYYFGLGLSRIHTGNLPLYLSWVFLGAVIFYLLLFLR
ncbi:MAG: NADH-quinone oxidoreductase subunit L [candidate division WOR-3 bacterium]|jgi:formate hydrogenlyase subunit 3/multisubunit Na+/H+ antiporter MnhD subunit